MTKLEPNLAVGAEKSEVTSPLVKSIGMKNGTKSLCRSMFLVILVRISMIHMEVSINGATPIVAGWLLGKIPSFEMMTQETPYMTKRKAPYFEKHT